MGRVYGYPTHHYVECRLAILIKSAYNIVSYTNFFVLIFFLLHLPGSLPQTPVFPILTIHFIKLSRCRPIVRMKFGHFYCHSVGTFHWNWEGWFKILYCKNETSLLVAVSMYFSVYVLLVLEFASCHLSISFTKWQPLSVSQKSFDFAVVPTYIICFIYHHNPQRSGG